MMVKLRQSIEFMATNTFQQVDEMTNTEPMNSEDSLHVCVYLQMYAYVPMYLV